MQVPIRKPGQFTHRQIDPYITEAKFDELKKKLDKLKQQRPQAIEEVKRLAMDGDFSENAAYQIAKGRLKGINQRILDIQEQLNKAIIIQVDADKQTVQLGHTVTVEINGREKVFQILGSAETNPAKGIISHNSPIGAALMGRKVGDTVTIKLNDKELECEILKIQ